jgi:hypothetical protein
MEIGNVLSVSALAAVDLAPSWLAADLRANLITLDPELQDALAAELIDLDDPAGRDEVAFCLAHVSPSHLASSDFYPALLSDNVESLLEIDAELSYADIVDYGDPLAGGDYYSTVRYRTSQDGENVEELELDRELYYWYIVFPVVEDELPTYINPTSGDPADPPTGRFWRDYLFFEADSDYQPLLSYVEEHDLLWKGRAYDKADNGAIGAIIQWVQDSLSFGSDSERPIQPVRIYAKHLGRCGEHGDITTAAARAALIPNINASAWANDHVWNEFWDQRWVQWEPVNTYVEHYYYYADANKNYYRSGLGVDNDCDGVVDEECDLADPTADADEDGFTREAGDCNDNNDTIFPGADELPDGRDNDCNLVADDGAAELDADQDDFSIAAGDCNDWDATVYPAAEENLTDGVDNDCNGTADDGTDESDADEDGYTIAAGDCDDNLGAVHPEAIDIADGLDNDCNGIADDGAAAADADGDGYSIEGGDCNDRAGAVHPGAPEEVPSNNRNFAVTAWRGDGKVWTISERYAGTFTLDVYVTDILGAPVDGATVLIAGYSTVYPSDPGIFIATWAATDSSGHALFELGEANEYYGRVESAIGNLPPAENTVTLLFDDPVKGEERSWEVELEAELPSLQHELLGEQATGEWSLDVDYAFDTGFVNARNFMTGSVFRDLDYGAALADVFVVDQTGYDALLNGEPFTAIDAALGGISGHLTVDLPDGPGPWYVVASASATAAGLVDGSLAVTAFAGDVQSAFGELPLTMAAGDLQALKIEPLAP